MSRDAYPIGKILEVLKENRIKGRIYEVSSFKMYYSGWECDSEGYLVSFVNEDGKYDRELPAKIILTSHGTPYLASYKEMHEIRNELDCASQKIRAIMIRAGMISTESEKEGT